MRIARFRAGAMASLAAALIFCGGCVEAAREIYKLARLSPTYSSWPHADVLQKRIDAGARARQALRGRSEARPGDPVPVLDRLRGVPRD